MTHRRGRRPAMLSLVALLLAVGSLPLNAEAATAGGDGNGKGNRSVTLINSPSTNNGSQMILGGNAGGEFLSQSASCKRKRVCNIRLNMYPPGW